LAGPGKTPAFFPTGRAARVLEAMGRLGSGAPVTQVALDLGYDSVSAFSAMFRRAAGASPSAYRPA